jgi:hypothetical protein
MSRRHNTIRHVSNGSRNVLHVPGDIAPPEAIDESLTPEERATKAGWNKGQLLNVQNMGSHYRVMLLGEDYNPQHPERAIDFTQPNDAQDFVSKWYAPEPGARPPWG